MQANLSVIDSDAFTYIVLPILIFLARLLDVSLGTIRIIFVSRGRKYLAPLIGFVEIMVWLVAIGKVMQNLSNVYCYIAYAGGFAAGNYIGMLIEEKLAMGTLIIHIITNKDASDLIENLRLSGYGVTSMDADGAAGPVCVIYSVIKRSAVKEVVAIVKQFNPNAFYSLEDVRFVSKEIYPVRPFSIGWELSGLFRSRRKGK